MTAPAENPQLSCATASIQTTRGRNCLTDFVAGQSLAWLAGLGIASAGLVPREADLFVPSLVDDKVC
jgi:hypothetical protein